jgi:hypothetical protein
MLDPPDSLSIFADKSGAKGVQRKKPIDLAKQPSVGIQKDSATVNDDGMEWHSRRIKRLHEQAKNEQRPLRNVVEDNFGVVFFYLEL